MSLSRESFRQWLLSHDSTAKVGLQQDMYRCAFHAYLEDQVEAIAARPRAFCVESHRVFGYYSNDWCLKMSGTWVSHFIAIGDKYDSHDGYRLSAEEALDVLSLVRDDLPEPDWSPIELLGGVE